MKALALFLSALAIATSAHAGTDDQVPQHGLTVSSIEPGALNHGDVISFGGVNAKEFQALLPQFDPITEYRDLSIQSRDWTLAFHCWTGEGTTGCEIVLLDNDRLAKVPLKTPIASNPSAMSSDVAVETLELGRLAKGKKIVFFGKQAELFAKMLPTNNHGPTVQLSNGRDSMAIGCRNERRNKRGEMVKDPRGMVCTITAY